LACCSHVAPGQAETISKFEFSNYLKDIFGFDHLIFGFVSGFDLPATCVLK